jgi:hypothetical protein
MNERLLSATVTQRPNDGDQGGNGHNRPDQTRRHSSHCYDFLLMPEAAPVKSREGWRMIRRAVFFISFTAAVYTLCSTVDAKPTTAVAIVREPWKSCPPDVDRYTDWLPNRPKPDGEIAPVPKDAIHEIATGQRAYAIGLLEYQEVIALTRVQAMHLVENGGSLVEGVGDPYLIRNVVPQRLAWIGLDRSF